MCYFVLERVVSVLRAFSRQAMVVLINCCVLLSLCEGNGWERGEVAYSYSLGLFQQMGGWDREAHKTSSKESENSPDAWLSVCVVVRSTALCD